jgi:hypothetical protein
MLLDDAVLAVTPDGTLGRVRVGLSVSSFVFTEA